MSESSYPFIGQADDQIFELCKADTEGYCLPLSSWTAEANWQGYATRYVANMPHWLPLVYVADHGVQCNTKLHDYESNHNFGVFCTWNYFKYVALKQSMGLKSGARLISNPMTLYWRKKGFSRKQNAKGTIVFLSHSGIGEYYPEIMTNQYADELAALPEKYHPIVLCVHRNDVLNGCLTVLRKHKFPVITLGWAGSPEFGDRFYNTISCFRYATSTAEMSALYYCIDFGIPFFLLGSSPELISNHNDCESAIGIGLKKTVDLLFRQMTDNITSEQQQFCDLVIGRSGRWKRLAFTFFVWGRILSAANLRRAVRLLTLKVTGR
jgi:hypothetical protein